MSARGLWDTSVFIAQESGRRLRFDALPDESFVSVVTLAELEAGVLAAPDTETRHRRMMTLQGATSVVPLTIGVSAASHWGRLRTRLHEAGRRINVNDLWIAATAVDNGLPVVSQDDDFDVLAELSLLEVIRV